MLPRGSRGEGKVERNWPQEKNFWKRKCNHQPSDGCFPEEMLALPSPHFPSVSARQSKKKRRAFPRKKTCTKIGSSLKTGAEKPRPSTLSLFFSGPRSLSPSRLPSFLLAQFPGKSREKNLYPPVTSLAPPFHFFVRFGRCTTRKKKKTARNSQGKALGFVVAAVVKRCLQ